MIKLKSKKIYIGIIGITVVLIGFVALLLASWIFHWETPRDKQLKEQGNQIVVQIEEFKNENNRLPKNLRELGLPESEEGPLYYNKNKDGINYTVSYSGSSLGESTYYDSEDKTWHDF